MKLKRLLSKVKFIKTMGDLNKNITKVVDNSKKACENSVFVAIKGLNFDGHKHIREAIKNGAVAIIYDSDIPNYLIKTSDNVSFIKVKNSRKALAEIASNFYGNPSRLLKIVGITGTNGKTSTCEFTYQILRLMGKKVGLISTIGAKYKNKVMETGFHVTTPEALELHRILKTMVKNGCKYVVLEVTSHALDQQRTWGINFDICGITNITPEHLDYHHTLRSYIKTKASIFKQSGRILLNRYDPSFEKLIKYLPKSKRCDIVDYKNYKYPQKFTDMFPGVHYKQNAAFALQLVKEICSKSSWGSGLDTRKLNDSLSHLKNVTGRMEYVRRKDPCDVMIDFAHDQTSLKETLTTVRNLTKGKLIVVFGCAGLRDKTKRPLIGRVAAENADLVVITAEDPRTESLSKINKSIERGLIEAGGVRDKSYFIIEDRQMAISYAIEKLAKNGDIVIITGKGHENSMCFGKVEYPWSDFEAVRKALKKR
jgi:UDP-N-acetylmuramoyl-L-alanyl-D-glutamate--2,6-diaminopimelate ligase